jgi:hypothetical protein
VIREVRVEGYSGKDTVTVTGLTGQEHYVLMNPFNASITAPDALKISVANVSNITYKGTSLDTVEMWDSKGDDTAVIGPNSGTMTGPGSNFVNKVSGVRQISAYSVRGGNDTLTLNGSDGADQFMFWMDSVTMSNVVGNGGIKPTYLNKASGFAAYVVDAGAGNDTATFYSGKGGEHLAVLDDKKTVELFSNFNAMDDALLKLIAFESLKFDAVNNRCSADIASINKALVDIDLIGDWVERNR